MVLTIAILLAFLLGSIPFGLLLTRAAGLGDIRAIGSGNIGATNVLRTGRRGLAAATLLLDVAKGAAAVLLARLGAARRRWPGWPPCSGTRYRPGCASAAARASRPGWACCWDRLAAGLRGLRCLAGGGGDRAHLLARGADRLRRRARHRWYRAAVSLAGAGDRGLDRLAPPQPTSPACAPAPSRGSAQGEPGDRLGVRLARTAGVGPITYRRLHARFATAAEALDALPGLARAGGRARRCACPPGRHRAGDGRGSHAGRPHAVPGRARLPALLAMLEDAPPVLSVLGDPAACPAAPWAWSAPATPRPTGSAWRRRWPPTWPLAAWWSCPAWRAASTRPPIPGRCTRRRTIAAVAGGLDMPYPPENAGLQARIAANGAVIAEAPLGTAPQSRHFPRRNRIIAGLSLGVVVVEAARSSGSLITAQLALDADRAIFAVPGSPLDPRCHGSNDLLRARRAPWSPRPPTCWRCCPTARRRCRSACARLRRGPERSGRRPPDSPPDSARTTRVAALLGPEPTRLTIWCGAASSPHRPSWPCCWNWNWQAVVETLTGHRVALLDTTRIT